MALGDSVSAMATNIGIGDTVLINSKLIGCELTPALVTKVYPGSDAVDLTVVHPSGLFPLERIAHAKGPRDPGWLSKDEAAAASAPPLPSNARTAPVSSSPAPLPPAPLPGVPPVKPGSGDPK